MKVLITGGCGRIGSHLVRRLLRGGDQVTVIDTRHGNLDGVKYIVAPLAEVTRLGRTDIVYHLAASIDYRASREELLERNVEPTVQLLRLCKDCRQFIFMSTTSVYNSSPGVITEQTPPDPYTNYGWSKLVCEQIIKRSGVPYTVLRSSQVYGPDFERGFASVLQRLQNGEMRILGNGDNYIPLIHIRDLLDALILVRRNPGAINQIFNVDGAYGKTQKEFMEIASRVLGVEPPGRHVSPALARFFGRLTGKGDSIIEYIDKLTKNRRISIDKIRDIGFEPKVDLESGIREVVKVFRERGLLK